MIRLLRDVLRVVLVLVLSTGLLALLFVAVVAIAGLAARPHVPDRAVLVLDLSQPLSESGRAPAPFDALMGAAAYPLPAHEAARALRAAADDDRIAAVFLRGDVLGSFGALRMVREALADVRASGKRVVAYPGSADERVLWFASAADEVWLQPLGIVQFDGWVAEVPYFGDALRRYGVEVQVTRVGKYKSAVEPFVLGEMSAENREQLEAVLAAIEADVFGAIATSRGLDVDTLRAASRERGWFAADAAREAGLVTHVGPFDAVLASLHALAGSEPGDELPQLTLAEYADATREAPPSGPGIAVVVAEGEIVDGTSDGGIGGDDLAAELRAARLDDDVRAVVMRVDSPGGSATASDVIRAEVLALRAAGKPVVVSMGTLAASGGYWISANADAIVAEPATLTGSIGVFGMLPNVEALAERHGLRAEQVRTSPLGGVDSLWKSKSPEQLALVQGIVDGIYERFLDLVVEGRGLERAAVHEVAQGRVWSGAAAVELGLVDELGGLDRAVALARERAGLDADAPVRFVAEEPEWFELLLRDIVAPEPERLARGALARVGGRLAGLDAALAQLERRGTSIQARLPFDWLPR